MISMTAGFEAEKNKKIGASPVWILKCYFASGTLYLTDRAITYTGITVKPWIAAWGNINEDLTDQLTTPIVSDFSAEIIIDPAEATDIHDLLWSETVETVVCELYLWFEGLTVADDPMILKWAGNITDFERVNELLYRVDFTDPGLAKNGYPGRVLSLADYPNASLDDVGYQMPIVYGTVTKSRALGVSVPQKTTLKADITVFETTFSLTDDISPAAKTIIVDTEEIYVDATSGANVTRSRRAQQEAYTPKTFTPFGYTTFANGYHLGGAIDGDVYVSAYGGDIYKQTGGDGPFVALGNATRQWGQPAGALTGNVYCPAYGGDIYMSSSGDSTFVALSQTTRSWFGMCAAPNGNIYAADQGGDIYMQTNGAGSFAALGNTTRAWGGMCAAPNGDIYAVINGGDIAMQTAGAGSFALLGNTTRQWYGICAAPNGDIYAVTGGSTSGEIFVRVAGAGSFTAIVEPPRDYRGMCSLPDGSIYTRVFNGDVYKRPGAAVAHSAGAVVSIKDAQGVFLWADHPVRSISAVYAKNLDGTLIDITTACTSYTGQTGSELAGYEAKAVVAMQVNDVVGDDIVVSGDGYQDSTAGDITGSATALIERPDHVFKHFLNTYASVDTTSFVTNTTADFAADGYKFSAVMASRRKVRDWCAYMALQCRSWFRFANDKAYLLYRPDTLASDKTITAQMIAMGDDSMTTLRVRRSPLDEVVNKIDLKYKPDWSKPIDQRTYRAVASTLSTASTAAYGDKERPDTFQFDFVDDGTMAADLANFYVTRYKDRKKEISFAGFLDNFEVEFADVLTIAPLSSVVCEVRNAGVAPGYGTQNDKVLITVREY